MATVTRGYSFGSTEQVTNTKLHTLVDSATVTSIVNADIDAGAAIDDTKLDLATIAQAIQFNGAITGASIHTMSSKIFKLAKGADVASVAGAITLGDDGNYFDITGTNAITSITAKTAGTVVTLQFDSTASLVDGSNLKLNGSFTGAAEAQITLVSDGTNWFEVSRNTSSYTPTVSNALSGSVIQMVSTQSGAVATGTTVIPFDDSIPQNTEGDEYITRAITPNNSSNLLLIFVVVQFSQTGTGTRQAAVALFQDTTANALAGIPVFTQSGATYPTCYAFIHKMTAGTTSSTTFKVRIGAESGQTISYNGSSGGRIFGGVIPSSITILEVKA